jgi:transposase
MGESPKVEARLGPVMETALALYMQDRHLKNESEVLRSVLGQMLDAEGYIKKAAAMLGVSLATVQENAHSPARLPEKPKSAKRVSYSKSRKRSKKR